MTEGKSENDSSFSSLRLLWDVKQNNLCKLFITETVYTAVLIELTRTSFVSTNQQLLGTLYIDNIISGSGRKTL